MLEFNSYIYNVLSSNKFNDFLCHLFSLFQVPSFLWPRVLCQLQWPLQFISSIRTTWYSSGSSNLRRTVKFIIYGLSLQLISTWKSISSISPILKIFSPARTNLEFRKWDHLSTGNFIIVKKIANTESSAQKLFEKFYEPINSCLSSFQA